MKTEAYVPPKREASSELQDVLSQTTELFRNFSLLRVT
jgi:hypothetical protein